MQRREYTLRFNTPAFLGNAEQNAQWRTPPFKSLLRQWWRMVYAADHGFAVNVAEMRREEGLLFGMASDGEGVSRKSQIRLRLDRWELGRLKNWDGLEQGTVYHPEVTRTNHKVGPHAYLGYGPIDGRGGTKLAEKVNAVIQANDAATLYLAVQEKHVSRIARALRLIDLYGTVGGRSRNGWGSFALIPQGDTSALNGQVAVRDWQECLRLDWPHAIGQDGQGPLIWQTAPHDDWKALMKTLAIVKIGLRTQFVFPNAAPPHPTPLQRHWLSYPITRHKTLAFDGNLRLPNSLRFKVRRTPEGKLAGVIFHVPCLPPPAFAPNRAYIIATWEKVHGLLDELAKPAGGRGYPTITDPKRLAALKPSLDRVILKRIPE